jgi:hypothetical protein
MAFLLFAAAVGVAARSYVTTDDISISAPPCPVGEHYNGYGLNTWRGLLILSRTRYVSLHATPITPHAFWVSEPAIGWRTTGYEFTGGGTWLGFGAASFETGWGGTHGPNEEMHRQWDVQIPLWAIATLWGLPAALWFRGVWRRARGARRGRLGLCPACGYDLRASADRCPECGRPITAPAAVAQSSWARELRPLAAALALLVAIGAVTGWRVYAHWEGSRLAWAEQHRIEQATASAYQAIGNGDAAALETAFRAGAVIAPADAGERMLQAIDDFNPEVARVLVAHGADITAGHGRALGDAINHGQIGLAIDLVKHGADVRASAGGVPGAPPLIQAASRCTDTADLELPSLLLERGADPNARDADGRTALQRLILRMEPTENGQAFLELLLAHGADVNVRDSQGLTPLGWVESMLESDWQRELAAFLRSRGARP